MTNNLYFDFNMKRYFFLCFLILGPVLAFSQLRFPDYYSVVSKFYSLYDHEGEPYEVLAFARKKDGWHVQVLDQAKNEAVKSSQLFWSLQKGRYQVLENFVGATSEPLDDKVMNFIFAGSPYNSYAYERSVYYGYNGWDADVIKDFENAPVKTDTLLEGLARAYSAMASRYLWYQYGGDTLSNDPLQKKLGRLEMPGNERVKKVAEYIGKAADSYEKIQRRNSSYQTMIGKIGLKTFNERFHGYMQLLMCNRPDEAAGFLAKCRLPFDDSVAAQNMFHSIKENGILITYGDNDTYPLLFLQEKYNIRKDVAVLNYGLLGLAANLDMLKRRNIVSFSTTAAAYGNNEMNYSVYYEQTDIGTKQKLQDFVTGYKNLQKMEAMNGDSIKIFDVKKLYMVLNRTDTLHIELGSYLSMYDFMIFDIICENFGKRPIYINDETGTYFAEALTKRGITWELPGSKVKDKYFDETFPDYIKNYKAPFTNYALHSSEYAYNANAHVSLFMAQVDHKLKSGDKSAADSLLKACFAAFGKTTPFVLDIETILSAAYQTGNEQLGNNVVETYINTVLENYEQKLQMQYYSKDFPIRLLEQLQTVLAKHNRSQEAVKAAISRVSL